jgi:hypothetical protein
MRGLVPRIHVFLVAVHGVDGRGQGTGHDAIANQADREMR